MIRPVKIKVQLTRAEVTRAIEEKLDAQLVSPGQIAEDLTGDRFYQPTHDGLTVYKKHWSPDFWDTEYTVDVHVDEHPDGTSTVILKSNDRLIVDPDGLILEQTHPPASWWLMVASVLLLPFILLRLLLQLIIAYIRDPIGVTIKIWLTPFLFIYQNVKVAIGKIAKRKERATALNLVYAALLPHQASAMPLSAYREEHKNQIGISAPGEVKQLRNEEEP